MYGNPEPTLKQNFQNFRNGTEIPKISSNRNGTETGILNLDCNTLYDVNKKLLIIYLQLKLERPSTYVKYLTYLGQNFS